MTYRECFDLATNEIHGLLAEYEFAQAVKGNLIMRTWTGDDESVTIAYKDERVAP